MTEARGIEERYISAGNSTNLKVEAERTSDADVLIAAGWTPGGLGHALLRLHGEWDGFSRARKIDRTEAILAMGHLKSLQACKAALVAWVVGRGMEGAEHLAIAVLGYWLDSVCHPCHGRGFESIRNTPALGKVCKCCEGSGRAKVPHGRDGHEALVLVELCVNRARDSMKNRLRPKNSATGCD